MYIYKHLQQIIKLIHLPFYSYLICTWIEQVFYGAILPYLSAIDFSSSLSDSLLFVKQSFHCQLSGSCKSFLTIIWHCCFSSTLLNPLWACTFIRNTMYLSPLIIIDQMLLLIDHHLLISSYHILIHLITCWIQEIDII